MLFHKSIHCIFCTLLSSAVPPGPQAASVVSFFLQLVPASFWSATHRHQRLRDAHFSAINNRPNPQQSTAAFDLSFPEVTSCICRRDSNTRILPRTPTRCRPGKACKHWLTDRLLPDRQNCDATTKHGTSSLCFAFGSCALLARTSGSSPLASIFAQGIQPGSATAYSTPILSNSFHLSNIWTERFQEQQVMR